MILKSSNQTNICCTDRPRLRCCRISPLYFGMFLLLLITAPTDTVEANQDLIDASIKKPFKQILLAHPSLADNTGTQVFKIDQDRLVLISVSRVAPEEAETENRQDLIRIGAIQARANILKFSHGVKVTNYRETGEKTDRTAEESQSVSLSSFFQIIEERVSGRVKKLPVIGSWREKDRGVFFVAVGMVKEPDSTTNTAGQKEFGEAKSLPSQNAEIVIDGKSPFTELLLTAHVLRENGGVRLFLINNQETVIMAVASAKIISGDKAAAERVARIKAVRELLSHEKGVQLSSVEIMADRESVRITNRETKRVLISNALSMQKESVEGFVTSLPVVARWTVLQGDAVKICIGGFGNIGISIKPSI